jgi:thioredoxin reductase (NADPH)
MRQQAGEFGVDVQEATVAALEHDGTLFTARLADKAIAARSVLLATGVVNNGPQSRMKLTRWP